MKQGFFFQWTLALEEFILAPYFAGCPDKLFSAALVFFKVGQEILQLLWQRQPYLSHVFQYAHCLIGNVKHGGHGTKDVLGTQQETVDYAAQGHQRKNSDLLGDPMGANIAGQPLIVDGNTYAGDTTIIFLLSEQCLVYNPFD